MKPIKLSLSAVLGLVFLLITLIIPKDGMAIPPFARQYNVKCSTCHTIFPRLNKTGYLFKRLGYRMPPDVEEGKAFPEVNTLMPAHDSTMDRLGFITSASVTSSKHEGPEIGEGEEEEGTMLRDVEGEGTGSHTSINLDEVELVAAGPVENSHFSYFMEYVLYEEGESELERGFALYTTGRTNSSFFLGIGKEHLQSGFRASDPHGLVEDDKPLGFSASSRNGFSLKGHPELFMVGYTHASLYYKYVFGITAKVMNSDGESNRKNFWIQADFLFGPDGGISAMVYDGRKSDETGMHEALKVRRYGLFGNYLFFDQLDILGGYLKGTEDWFGDEGIRRDDDTRSVFGEIDYYFQTGFAALARYDKVKEKLSGSGMEPLETTGYLVGFVKTLTDRQNAKLSLTYGYQKVTGLDEETAKGKEIKLGFDMGW